MKFRQQILRAGAWTVASHGIDLSTRLLSNLIMTRLLYPDAFGTVAVATALIVGLQLISDFGVRTVIIQSPRGRRRGLSKICVGFPMLARHHSLVPLSSRVFGLVLAAGSGAHT